MDVTNTRQQMTDTPEPEPEPEDEPEQNSDDPEVVAHGDDGGELPWCIGFMG